MTDEIAVGEDKIFTLDEVAKKINIIEIRFILANRFPHLEIIDKSEYDRLKRLEENTRPGLYQRVHDDEYQRLKRLDENVKRKIIKLKKDEADYADIEPNEYDEVRQRLKYEIEILESLDK